MSRVKKRLPAFVRWVLLGIKWLCVVIGAALLCGVLWIAIRSFGEIGEDVSQLDVGYDFELAIAQPDAPRPNVLLIMADDLGYQDLSCYGSPMIKTPRIDSLAANGVRFTDHYASASVCSPSRYGLLTGRYPIRGGFSSLITPTGLPYSKKFMWHLGKIFIKLGTIDMGADSKYNGIRHREITLAEALKKAGYATGMSGKWHLGDLKTYPSFNPLQHGFDDFLGLNVANDEFPAALFDNDSMLVEDVGYEQDYLTRIFTDRAIGFIRQKDEKPFFYFLSLTAPHLPLIPSESFEGTSEGGIYGDVVEEIDFHVGRLMDVLTETGQRSNTLVIFTSDNGPWFKGSPGAFRGRKGQSYEGGFRVPLILSFPTQIPLNSVCEQPVMNMDLFPSILGLAGLTLPQDRIIDGKDLWPLATRQDSSALHEALFFYHFNDAEAVRMGDWKYFTSVSHYIWPVLLDREGTVTHDMAEPWFGQQIPNLYDLSADPGENYDLMHLHPEVGNKLQQKLDEWNASLAQNPDGWLE